ncbi:MAG: MBL fold metallo-hydrolase [Bacillaceae bacterium]
MVNLAMETDYFTLMKLTDGIYAAIAKMGSGAWSNAGVVDLGEELLIFDSFSTPSAARELREQAEMITGKKVKYLINSHYHGDHVFGNQVFKDTTIISTSLTHQLCKEQHVIEDVEKEQEEMVQYLRGLENQIKETTDTILKTSLLNQYEDMFKVLEDVPQLKIVLPSVIFEQKLVIHGSTRSVELYCLGGGHSPSDTFMYAPNEKIAFMGDIVTENLHVPIYQPKQFLSMLKDVKQMAIEIVVPGHGNVGTLALCDTLINYLSFLIEKAKEAHQNKVSLNDFITSFSIPSEYRKWGGINGINRNLATVYRFCEKKEEK